MLVRYLVKSSLCHPGSPLLLAITLQPSISLQGKRLGVFSAWNAHANPEVVACIELAQRASADAGAEVCQL